MKDGRASKLAGLCHLCLISLLNRVLGVGHDSIVPVLCCKVRLALEPIAELLVLTKLRGDGAALVVGVLSLHD